MFDFQNILGLSEMRRRLSVLEKQEWIRLKKGGFRQLLETGSWLYDEEESNDSDTLSFTKGDLNLVLELYECAKHCFCVVDLSYQYKQLLNFDEYCVESFQDITTFYATMESKIIYQKKILTDREVLFQRNLKALDMAHETLQDLSR
jgi:CMP-N-acetylneuraminic acid synthetase